MPCDYYLSPEDLKTAKENGVSAKRAHERFYYLNWSKERAVTTPVRTHNTKERDWAEIAEKNGISRNTYYKRRE